MNMLNGELNQFCEFLMAQELDGKNSRMRTRFVKLASERISEVEQERVRLVQKYAIKNDNDEPIVTKHQNGTETVGLTDPHAFNDEYREVLVEEFIIDETEERKEMLLTIKNIVLNTSQTFKENDAILYDRWCDIVESLSC